MMAYKTLGEVANYINGRAFKPTEWESNGLPIIRIQNLNNPSAEYNYTQHKYDEKFLVRSGDLLFAWSASLGAFIWHGSDAWLNQHIFKVVPHEMIDKKYLYYFLIQVIDELYSKTHGSGMVHITITPFKATPIALPPLPEQHRIVARIESLFEKLDHARELVQSALDSFETRKASILHKAFTGELTAKWREKNGVGIESWKIIPLSQLAHIQTGLAKGKKNTKRTIQMPYLRVANVQDGYLDLAEIKTISVEENKVDRYILQQEDVLFTEGGDFDKLGRGAVWQSEIEPCLHQNHVFAVRPDQSTLNAFYLAYLAGSQYGKNYFLSCSKQTTNLASINSTQLKAFPVLCPQIKEQQEIICVLTRLIKKEQQAKDQLEPILDQIDMMKKSILARAFRGELGTNDPSEESAMELLKNL
ncbi:restriction endonuclease subunit S [Phascolarctobacterium faecium]|uniref:restriction endonuclease subunit S n=1 Tax=Phascolarctobacterium faecium TaxID=33025 RepID=UPI003A8B4F67